MSKFISHIHCRPVLKMGQLDHLSKWSWKEKSGIAAHFVNEGQLLDLGNNYFGEEEDWEYMKLEGIDVAVWKKKNRLYVVLQEHRLEVLHQH